MNDRCDLDDRKPKPSENLEAKRGRQYGSTKNIPSSGTQIMVEIHQLSKNGQNEGAILLVK